MRDEKTPNQGKNNDKVFQERRKFLRLNINVDINYSVIAGDDSEKTDSENISAGGICMHAHEELKKGDKLKLDIDLPDNPPVIQAVGRVVWTKSFNIADEKSSRYDVGVEFINISEEDQERIKRYVFSLK